MKEHVQHNKQKVLNNNAIVTCIQNLVLKPDRMWLKSFKKQLK